MDKFLSVFQLQLNSFQPRYILNIDLLTLRQSWKGFMPYLAHKHKPNLVTYTKTYAHNKQVSQNRGKQVSLMCYPQRQAISPNPKTQKSDLRAVFWRTKSRQTSSTQPPFCSTLSVLLQQDHLHHRCCKLIPCPRCCQLLSPGVSHSLPQEPHSCLSLLLDEPTPAVHVEFYQPAMPSLPGLPMARQSCQKSCHTTLLDSRHGQKEFNPGLELAAAAVSGNSPGWFQCNKVNFPAGELQYSTVFTKESVRRK